VAPDLRNRKLLRIFLSSPGDVAEERALAEIVFRRLADEVGDAARLELVIWEHEPLFAHTGFQQQIDRPSQCDLVVSILWSRLGTRLPADFAQQPGVEPPTGTEFEINDALSSYQARGKPNLLIYRKVPAPHVGLGSPDFAERSRQYQMLDDFCRRAFHDADGALTVAHHTFTDSHEFERRLAEHLRRWLDREIQAADATTVRPRWRGGSPFRGLQTFEAEHQAIFFGRSEALGDLIGRIRDSETNVAGEQTSHLLIVQGMSGSGKTSLIKAGLLPLLAHRPIEGIALWRSVSLRPSESSAAAPQAGPLGVLAMRIAEQLPAIERLGVSVAQLATALHDAPLEAVARIEMGLAAEAARSDTAPHRARLVIYIDQLEEAFTLNEALAHAEALFAAFSALARSPHVWVLATLRSDFAHHLEAFPEFMKALGQSPAYTLLPPRPDELADMIREPALAAGLLWETRQGVSLDQELLRDCSGNPEALPLLEYTLQQLYERRDGRVLRWSAYEGGLRGALIAAAEDVVGGAGDEAEAGFRTVMRELVGVGEDGAATRRYAALSRFAAGTAGRTLLDQLIARRLCVTTDLGRGEGPVTCLAHEALIRSWPRVQSWLQTETALLRIRDELLRDAAVWERHDRSDDWLGTAPEKIASIRQVEGAGLLTTGVAGDYAHRSRRRASRNRLLKRTVIAGIGVLSVVSVIAGIFAVKQRDMARAQQAAADRTSRFMVSLFQQADPTGVSGGAPLTAREMLDRGAKSVSTELKNEPAIRADLLTAMGQAYSGLGLYKPAEELLASARDAQNRISVPPESRVRTLLASGYTDYLASNYQAAEKTLRQAVDLARRELAPEDPLRSEALDSLADVLVPLEKFDEAEQLCNEALAADRRRGQDQDHVALLARTLDTLATIYFYEDRLAEAEPAFREALALRDQAFGRKHALTAQSLNNLGALLYQSGRFVEATRYYNEALSIDEAIYGLLHPEVATTLNNTGRSALMAGRVDEAQDLFRRALAVFDKVLEPTSDQLIAPLNSLAMIDAFQGRLDMARSEIERAERIARMPDYGDLLDQVLLTAADVYLHLGEKELASARLNESLRLLQAKYPQRDDPAVAWRYAIWETVNAQLQMKSGDAAAAERALRQARDVIQKRFGPRGFYVQLVERRLAALKQR
jgi:tetratricopeptide (TPR) repeat protein